MIQIVRLETVDASAFDHVKCPQCRSRLCGKPKDSRVHIMQAARKTKENLSPLLFTCKRCRNHFLVSTAGDEA